MTHRANHIRSEKGMALVIVLLLLAVMAALTTGLTLNGQTEIAMASNELYYAGARSAAEAGMNRAIQQITADNSDLLLTGLVPDIGNGPFDLGDYQYSFEILDDDNDLLYATALTNDQRTAMNEQNPANLTVSQNPYIILRVTGTGPKDTVVRVSRVLQITTTPGIPAANIPVLSNPAILVNGGLDMSGNVTIGGLEGNVHANGNITGGGSVDIQGDLTATGTISPGLHGDGLTAANQSAITVPEVKANDYLGIADWVLTSGGERRTPPSVGFPNGKLCGTAGVAACPSGWTWNAGTQTWSASGAMPATATYYVQGHVEVHGTGKSSMTMVSIIAEGNIKLTGNGKFKPENTSNIQFVTNGDFEFGGTVDADPDYDLDGQIMVREQMKIYGNTTFKGRVIVEDRASASNAWNATTNPNGRKGSSALASNTLTGNMTVTYDGTLPEVITMALAAGTPTTYTYNVSGWIEQ